MCSPLLCWLINIHQHTLYTVLFLYTCFGYHVAKRKNLSLKCLSPLPLDLLQIYCKC